MKVKLGKLITDEGKLGLNMVEDFYPIPEDKTVKLKVERLKNGESLSYMNMNTRTFNLPSMFNDKVLSVEGIEVEDDKGNVIPATAKMITDVPNAQFAKIVMVTTTYLLSNIALSGDEVKNLD